MRLSVVLRWIGVATLLAFGLGAIAFWRDMAQAYRRIEGGSRVVASQFGEIEFAEGGSGQSVLVVHGSGGGYDQGALIAETLVGNDFHWIAPSRFGYLRSSLPPDATFDAQAHAFAALLDRLGISEVAVVTLSHGGPSGALFAALYPDRVSSLTLVSSGIATSTAAGQVDANARGNALSTVFSHDSLYWGITKLLRSQFFELMGANAAVVAALTPEQRRLADLVVDSMNPVSPRSAGAAFDNQAAMPNERVAAIRAPTLVVHAKDDLLQLYHNAEFAAAHIPSAQLASFEHGGHLLMIVERDRVRALTQEHIRKHPGVAQ